MPIDSPSKAAAAMSAVLGLSPAAPPAERGESLPAPLSPAPSSEPSSARDPARTDAGVETAPPIPSEYLPEPAAPPPPAQPAVEPQPTPGGEPTEEDPTATPGRAVPYDRFARVTRENKLLKGALEHLVTTMKGAPPGPARNGNPPPVEDEKEPAEWDRMSLEERASWRSNRDARRTARDVVREVIERDVAPHLANVYSRFREEEWRGVANRYPGVKREEYEEEVNAFLAHSPLTLEQAVAAVAVNRGEVGKLNARPAAAAAPLVAPGRGGPGAPQRTMPKSPPSKETTAARYFESARLARAKGDRKESERLTTIGVAIQLGRMKPPPE